MTSSPLGPFGPLVAAVTALGLIGALIVQVVILGQPADETLKLLAVGAFGAIFGAVATQNGWKGPVAAAHARLDAAGIPAAGHETPHP